MTRSVCTDDRHDTPCEQPCPGCAAECPADMLVTLTVTPDGLLAPQHAHDPASFDSDCRACLLAESGSLNDGSLA